MQRVLKDGYQNDFWRVARKMILFAGLELNEYPNLIWNNRLGSGYKGDTETPEQFIPAQGYPGRDWEACMTMNDTWGYKSYDTNFKSAEALLRNLIDIASESGKYLLNIGPDSKDRVPSAEVERLHQMGQWLFVNDEAIYGTHSALFDNEAGSYSTTEKYKKGKPEFIPAWNWRSTTSADRIYIELFTWPKATSTSRSSHALPPLSTCSPTRPRLLSN